MSVIKRFRNRKALSATVDVPLELDGEKLTLEIARYSESENMGAMQEASLTVAKYGIEDPKERQHAMAIAYNSKLFDILKRHVKGWKHESEDPIPFSKENCEALFAEFGIEERNLVLNGYLRALAEDKGRAEGNEQASAEVSQPQ